MQPDPVEDGPLPVGIEHASRNLNASSFYMAITTTNTASPHVRYFDTLLRVYQPTSGLARPRYKYTVFGVYSDRLTPALLQTRFVLDPDLP
jgi:hypothetical protein